LLSESRRADSGGEDLGEGAASPLPTSEGIGEHCKLPSAPLNDFSVLHAALNCYVFLGKQLQKSLNLAAKGLCQPPGGQKLHEWGGYHLQPGGCANPPGGQKLHEWGGYHLQQRDCATPLGARNYMRKGGYHL